MIDERVLTCTKVLEEAISMNCKWFGLLWRAIMPCVTDTFAAATGGPSVNFTSCMQSQIASFFASCQINVCFNCFIAATQISACIHGAAIWEFSDVQRITDYIQDLDLSKALALCIAAKRQPPKEETMKGIFCLLSRNKCMQVALFPHYVDRKWPFALLVAVLSNVWIKSLSWPSRWPVHPRHTK